MHLQYLLICIRRACLHYRFEPIRLRIKRRGLPVATRRRRTTARAVRVAAGRAEGGALALRRWRNWNWSWRVSDRGGTRRRGGTRGVRGPRARSGGAAAGHRAQSRAPPGRTRARARRRARPGAPARRSQGHAGAISQCAYYTDS